jgi:hypothetical protein
MKTQTTPSPSSWPRRRRLGGRFQMCCPMLADWAVARGLNRPSSQHIVRTDFGAGLCLQDHVSAFVLRTSFVVECRYDCCGIASFLEQSFLPGGLEFEPGRELHQLGFAHLPWNQSQFRDNLNMCTSIPVTASESCFICQMLSACVRLTAGGIDPGMHRRTGKLLVAK